MHVKSINHIAGTQRVRVEVEVLGVFRLHEVLEFIDDNIPETFEHYFRADCVVVDSSSKIQLIEVTLTFVRSE